MARASQQPARPDSDQPALSPPIDSGEHDVGYLKRQLTALISQLVKRGHVDYMELLQATHRLEGVTHENGARVVAHAWADADFKEGLRHDGKGACAELGIDIQGYDELQVVENTDRIHHVVVCTSMQTRIPFAAVYAA